MRKHPQIVIGVLLIALFVCIAITAPLLAPNDPNTDHSSKFVVDGSNDAFRKSGGDSS